MKLPESDAQVDDPDWDYREAWDVLVMLEQASQMLRSSLKSDTPSLESLRQIYQCTSRLETLAGEAQW